MTSITIRNAELTDIDWLIPELREFSKFFGSKIPLFDDEQYARDGLKNLITSHLFFVASSGDKPVGFISGLVTNHIWNPKIKVLTEVFWWVIPAYRTASKAGLMLLKAFTDWGTGHVNWINFTLEHNSPVSDRSLLKRGFKPTETNYLLEVT